MKAKLCIVLLLGMVLLVACRPAANLLPTAEPTLTPQPATATRTSAPSQTPLPSQTSTQTLTAQPTPLTDFSTVRVINITVMTHYQCLITLETKDPIRGNYHGVVAGIDPYPCTQLAQYPNRLYCVGKLASQDGKVNFKLYEQSNPLIPVYSADLLMPRIVP